MTQSLGKAANPFISQAMSAQGGEQGFADRARALSRVPLFHTLAPELHLALARTASQRAYEARDVVFREGDRGAALYVVSSGGVKITVSTTNSELVLAILGPGQYFGEMALLDGLPRSATAVALEPTVLVMLTHEVFIGCLTEFPKVALALLVELCGQLRTTNLLAADLTTHGMEVRVIHKLLNLATACGEPTPLGLVIPISISQQDLANMVNGSREAVNRILQDLRKEGLVRWERGRITLHDTKKLEEWLLAAV